MGARQNAWVWVPELIRALEGPKTAILLLLALMFAINVRLVAINDQPEASQLPRFYFFEQQISYVLAFLYLILYCSMII